MHGIKILLLITVFLSSALFGLCGACEERSRLRRLEGLLALVRFIGSEVRYYSAPLGEIFGKFSCRALEECGFIRTMREKSFSAALDALRSTGTLDDGTYQALSDFGSSLGACCTDDQITRCADAETYLTDACSEKRTELPKRVKLHTTIGFCVGVMLVILLV